MCKISYNKHSSTRQRTALPPAEAENISTSCLFHIARVVKPVFARTCRHRCWVQIIREVEAHTGIFWFWPQCPFHPTGQELKLESREGERTWQTFTFRKSRGRKSFLFFEGQTAEGCHRAMGHSLAAGPGRVRKRFPAVTPQASQEEVSGGVLALHRGPTGPRPF